MAEEQKQRTRSHMRSDTALVMSILSGIGSFGSLILNLSSTSGLDGPYVLWFQVFAALTILLAVVFMGIEWDLKRDKWPGIEDRYLQLDFVSSVADPKSTPDAFLRLRIESLRKRKRLALSQGNLDLANQYQSEIDETEKHLEKS